MREKIRLINSDMIEFRDKILKDKLNIVDYTEFEALRMRINGLGGDIDKLEKENE